MRNIVLLPVAALIYFGFSAILIWKARSPKERTVIVTLAVGILVLACGLAYLFPGQHVHFHTPGGFINHYR